MLRFNQKIVATTAVAAISLTSLTTIAEEAKALSEDEAKQVEELTTEIQRLNEQLVQITGPAEEPVVEEVEEEAKLWSGDVEFGYVDVSGNTEESSTKARASINREREEWRYGIFFDSLNSETDGDRTAEKYFLSNRLAYQYSEHNYVFGYASYEDDHFSGYDYQATASIGYGRRILNDETMQWDLEIGPGYRESKVDEDSTEDDESEAILRVFTKYNWDFTDSANFSQTLSVEGGEENTVTRSITALRTDIMGAFSLKLSYTIKYSENVPASKQHADTETAVTLNYSF